MVGSCAEAMRRVASATHAVNKLLVHAQASTVRLYITCSTVLMLLLRREHVCMVCYTGTDVERLMASRER